MNHPKRKEKCRQLLFPSCYHNVHVSLETETPKIRTACISLFTSNKIFQMHARINRKFCFGELQSSSPLQRKLPYSLLPPAAMKARLQQCYELVAAYQHLQAFLFFLWHQTSFPVPEGDCWLLSRSQDTRNAKQHLLFKSPRSQNTLEKGSLGQITVSAYHIACTDTGLNM